MSIIGLLKHIVCCDIYIRSKNTISISLIDYVFI